MQRGEPLTDDVLSKKLQRAEGGTTTLRDLIPRADATAATTAAPTLLVFVRQFACAGCSERMTELLIHLEILHSSGVNVIVVGCGSVEHARALRDRLDLESRPITVVTDPTLAVHKAVGLNRTLWGVIGAKGTWNLVRAMANGHKNAWSGGDFYQLGGTILLDENAKIVMNHEERHLGETMPIGDVVERALALMAERTLKGADVP